MPPPILRALRSAVAGNRPTGRTYGELYVNYPDGQLGAINQSAGTQDLIAVRNFSSTASYVANDLAAYNGEVVAANRTLASTAWNPQNFISMRKRRNRILNGGFLINQFNGGSTRPLLDTTPYCNPDTWGIWAGIPGSGTTASLQLQTSQAGYTGAFINVPCAGVASYLAIKSTAANSLANTNFGSGAGGFVPGWDIEDFAWGTPQARPATLSFMVFSTIAGTYGGIVQNWAGNRTYPFTYSIPTANTWTYVALTIPGDTNTVWRNTAGAIGFMSSIWINFELGVNAARRGTPFAWVSNTASNINGATGATNFLATNNAVWGLANVQFEIGPIASPFDQRLWDEEKDACTRYTQTNYPGSIMPGADMSATWDGAMYAPCAIGTSGGANMIWQSPFVTVTLSPPMAGAPSITTYNMEGSGGMVTMRDLNNVNSPYPAWISGTTNSSFTCGSQTGAGSWVVFYYVAGVNIYY